MKSKTTGDLPNLRTLLEAGAHFGHRRARSSPASQKFTFAVRDGVCVINLEETQSQLAAASRELEERVAQGAVVLIVGTKDQAKITVAAIGQRVGMPFVAERWLGGTLTNFGVIRKSIERLKGIEKMLADEAQREKYTKREWARLEEQTRKLHTQLDGITELVKLPDLLLVIDPHEEVTAVREARQLDIPVIAVCDTDADPDQFFLPIPANDDAPKTIELVLNFLGEAIERGRGKRKVKEG